jgi:hypothetical protein
MSGAEHLNFTRNEKPGLWEPKQALTFFELCNKIDVHLREGLPMTRETLLVICFHETGFSNIKQGRGSGPAVGFGQMEIFNVDKIPFFKWLKPPLDAITHNPNVPPAKKKAKMEEHGVLPAFEKLTAERVTSDHDFAVKMHCKYFEWLLEEGRTPKMAPGQKGLKTIQAMLEAQTGGDKNLKFVPIFRDGGRKLKEVIYSGDRQKVIDALNSVMLHFKKGTDELENQSVKLDRFTKYWDFTLPESEMIFGFRK